MQDIILNLKQVRFRRMVDTVDSEVANLTISGKSEFTAEDISKGLSSFKVLNPELHICSLEPSVKLTITLTIHQGPRLRSRRGRARCPDAHRHHSRGRHLYACQES